MNKNKKYIAVLLIFILIVGCALLGCDPPPDPVVDKIRIIKAPTKTEYFVGEDFSAVGGEIEVTYDNDSKVTLNMTAEGVVVEADTNISESDPPMQGESNKWERTGYVRFGGRRVSFEFYVSYQLYTVTLDYNYDGITETKSVRKGYAFSEPAKPSRPGEWEFNAWFKGALPYDFSELINQDVTLVANWLNVQAELVEFTFDQAYYGAKNRVTTITKNAGDLVTPLSVTRIDYKFEGWFTAETGGILFDFNSPITKLTTVYAQWTRIKTGTTTYVFEAENVDLTNNSGPGISGVASGGAMIITSTGKGASDDRFLSFLNAEAGGFFNTQIDFRLASDVAVNDVTLVLRLSAEMRNYDMNSSNYKIYVNNTDINYSQIRFLNVPPWDPQMSDTNCLPFQDYTIGINISLMKGSNIISLVTSNTNPIAGTTIEADAPLVDCLKITTSAVVIWDGVFSLPFYY